MATELKPRRRKTGRNPIGKPFWDMAHFFPLHGSWTEEDFLEHEDTFGNRMIELADGCLEILPMPTLKHQRVVKRLLNRVDEHVLPRKLGEAAMAPLPVRLFSGRIREPDILFFEARRKLDADARLLDGADLVMEVPSPGKKNRQRDLVIKRREYAKAGIREYWIVDLQERTITVLTLSGKTYKVHGVFKEGTLAASKLLKGFEVAVSDALAAGEGQ